MDILSKGTFDSKSYSSKCYKYEGVIVIPKAEEFIDKLESACHLEVFSAPNVNQTHFPSKLTLLRCEVYSPCNSDWYGIQLAKLT